MSMTYVLQAPITLTNGVNTSEVEINDTTLNNIMNYINANASPDYIMQNTFDVNGNSLYTDANNLASQGQYFPLNYLNLIGVGPLSSYNTTVPVSSIEYYWLQVAKQLASNPNNPVGGAQNWLPVGIVVAILVIVLLLAK
jgi:hypothetical protein